MGKGGGGGGHTPVEAKESGRSKQFGNIIEVISEGEIEGLVNGMKSVFLDKTQVQNDDDSYNFSNVQVEGRVGSQSQEIIPGFNTSEKEISVGTQVRKVTPITRTVTDAKVSRLRLTLGVQSLFSQADNGDTNGTNVNLTVYIGEHTYPITIRGKYSSQYLQQHTFENLPPVPFTVRVERNTDDSKSQRLQNNTVWASYTEIIDTEFTYPNTAIIGVKFDSEYFSGIPNRTYDVLGIKVKVPSNYDPQTRQYNGMWDGTFKLAWTDNPAWILYDVVTNKRYGLGQRLGEFGADKWALYQVAQYCDQLVPDGFGGQEPRFTCNVWLTEQRAAYDVINDLCSIFRAMPVWNGRELTVVMDRPSDPVWTYTNANVENGEFTYVFSAKKARHNAIQVEYADKDNAYEKTIEYVSDDEAIRRNGLNVKKVTAFGCTSRGQAHRTGLWLLQTEKLETKTVTFTVGAEGLMHVPGDIIKVADVDYAGTDIGGRVLKIDGRKVTLDREIDITANSYFTYTNGEAKHQDIKILSVTGRDITLDSTPIGLTEYGVWSLTAQNVNTQLFRALSVKEESKGKYTIVALQHEPQKEAIVDNGAKFEPKAVSILALPKVNDIQITTGSDDSISINADVSGGAGTVKYDIYIYKGDKVFDVRLGLKSPELDLNRLENGDYFVVVQAKSEEGQLLNERTQRFTIDKPLAPTGLRATSGLATVTLEWDWVNEATATEIFAAETDDISTAQRIAKVTARVYTHEVGAKQVRYYWLRHTRGVNVGPFNQQSGFRAESAVDIEAELQVLNEKLAPNIVDEVIDTALPARNLELIKSVDGLDVDTFIGYSQVHNTTDGKLYTWNGSKYVDNSVNVSKLQIPTQQLTGTISAAQIAANAIGTEHLGANVITADKMSTNSVSAAALQAGAVRANHVASNELTADKLAIGLGGNLLMNPLFDNDGYGWRDANAKSGDWSNCPNTWVEQRIRNDNATYNPKGLQNERWRYLGLSGTAEQFNTVAERAPWVDVVRCMQSVVKDKWYIISAYVGGLNCGGQLIVEKYSTDERSYQGAIAYANMGAGNVHNKRANYLEAPTGYFERGVAQDTKRVFVKFKAPDTGKVMFIFRINQYAKNVTAADFFVARPMLEECTEHTKEPSPWQNAGVTAIHGGSIVTDTVTAQQIAANTITGNEIAAGTVAAKNLAAGSVNAVHVASKSLTADKLNVSSLSAISADLGQVTAGTVTGTTIEGNTIRGGTVSGTTVSGSTITGSTIVGTTIEGGVIRSARLEGVNGKFTGELEVTQLIGGGVIEHVSGYLTFKTYRTTSIDVGAGTARAYCQTHAATVSIQPAPTARFITFFGVEHESFVLQANQAMSFTVSSEIVERIFDRNKKIPFMIVAYAISTPKTISFS